MPSSITATSPSPWPHRLVVALALVTFPLIWVGGLVTTYDAGMAVPDWPGTYGYNLFRYPWQTWFAGPWDLFIEHGHRLLGAAAGLLAIALVLAAWLIDTSRSVRLASLGALVLVVVQGALGGARVLLDERLLALIHGCVGPLFFAYLAALAVATSPAGQAPHPPSTAADNRFLRGALLVVALAYLQLFLGAVLRHIPVSASPTAFRAALVMHLLVATALLIHAMFLASRFRRTAHLALATSLAVLVAAQITLGGSTYIVKYAFPIWLHSFQYAATYVVQEKSLPQALITTAHVAMGSLILFLATLQTTLAARPFFAAAKQVSAATQPLHGLKFSLPRSAA